MNNLASELLKIARLVVSVPSLKLVHRNRGYHDNQSDNSIVALVDGEVIGFLDYSEYHGEIAVQMIEVDEKFRRQGIGIALLKELDKEYPEVEIEYGMETSEGARLIEEYQRRYPKKLDFERGFSNRDFVLRFVPDYGKNTGEVSWHTIDYAFSETGLDLRDYDFNWAPGKEQFEQDIKRVKEKGWAAAAKQLRSDLGIKHNAEIRVAKMASRQASEKVGPGDSDLAFELATEIPRTDKALRATFSKSFRKGPREMLKAISRLEEPYVTLRRQSRWLDGAQEPWKEVSVNDAKQLIVLGKKLRKDLSKLLRENKIAADQQYDTDYLPRRSISPDNKWEMPDMGEEPISEITHCQHSVNPMERGKHLMMSRELLKVAKDLLAMEFPAQDALDKYLKEHPAANRSLHRVVETKPTAPSPVVPHPRQSPARQTKTPEKPSPVEAHHPVNLAQAARKKFTSGKLSGGNCGQFALAMAKYLHDKGEKDVKLALITEATDDDVNTVEKLQNIEPKIYHVFVQHKGEWYDGTGKINKQSLVDLSKREYGDDAPSLWTDIEPDDTTRKLMEWETNWTIPWDKFYGFFEGQSKKASRQAVSELPNVIYPPEPFDFKQPPEPPVVFLAGSIDMGKMDTPEWVSPAFVSQLDIAGTNLKKYSATYRGVQTWALQSKSKVYKDQYGWVSALWTVNPALDGQNWVIESALSFAPATSGSFANQKFAEFKATVTIAGKKDLAMFGAERHVLTVKPDETNALREVNGVIAQHRDSFNAAKKFWKSVK